MEKLKVHVTIDRPIGYQDAFGNIYPINYGYISGVIGGDEEEQDAYILNEPDKADSFIGIVSAIIHRRDDNETKWIVIPEGTSISEDEIIKQTYFIEQHFDSYVELL